MIISGKGGLVLVTKMLKKVSQPRSLKIFQVFFGSPGVIFMNLSKKKVVYSREFLLPVTIIMENFYCLVRISVWLSNLEFGPKNRIQKLWSYFSMSYIITRVYTSFWCNFSLFFSIFSHFWCTFCVFCGQAEIKQTPNHPIKIRHMKKFWGCHTSRREKIPNWCTKKKSFLLFFLSKKTLHIIWHDVKASKSAKMMPLWPSFCVKICEMCYFQMFSIRQT